MEATIVKHQVPPQQECDKRFLDAFTSFAKDYNIRASLKHEQIHAQRISFLCGNEMIKLYGVNFAPDAQYQFYQWATKHKLNCDELVWRERKYKKNGKFEWVPTPFPSSYYTFYQWCSFKHYFKIAESILFPARQPILKREPVTRLKDLR